VASSTVSLPDRRTTPPAPRLTRPSPRRATESRELLATSCEELERSGAGDVRYAQLEPGRLRCRVAVVGTARAQLRHESWSTGLLKQSRTPDGCVAFALSVGPEGSLRIQGRAVRPGDVVVSFSGDELDCRSAGPAQLVTVTLERTMLEARVRTLLGAHFGELRLRGRLRGMRTDAAALRRLCLRLAADAACRHDYATGLKELETSLVGALFAETGGSRDFEPPPPSRALARRAEAWLRQNLTEPPTIASLCRALDASERTVHEAFRRHLDTTPKAYLKLLRLNAARHDLLQAEKARRVTDVALDWGFLHFGWFSQDYRRLFGETPSQTLRRGRERAPSAPHPRWPLPHDATPAARMTRTPMPFTAVPAHAR
jgi:AraC family ethanolamine operon transcriptional activator